MYIFYLNRSCQILNTGGAQKLLINGQLFSCLCESKLMSRIRRKPTFCKCENDADQLRGNCKADQRLSFCYIDNEMPLLSKSEISRIKPSSVAVQPGVGNQNVGFLMTRLICMH